MLPCHEEIETGLEHGVIILHKGICEIYSWFCEIHNGIWYLLI